MIEDNDFSLVDDGTLDTVFQCNHCGTMHRFNYDALGRGYRGDDDAGDMYEDFVADCRDTLETEGCNCHDDN